MRIVDRKTFLALPAGTVYAKYEPCVFEELEIKDARRGTDDWYAQGLIPSFETDKSSLDWADTLFRIAAGEQSPPFDFDRPTDDGCYDDDQLFAVFDRADVEGLIARLQRALAEGYAEAGA